MNTTRSVSLIVKFGAPDPGTYCFRRRRVKLKKVKRFEFIMYIKLLHECHLVFITGHD